MSTLYTLGPTVGSEYFDTLARGEPIPDTRILPEHVHGSIDAAIRGWSLPHRGCTIVECVQLDEDPDDKGRVLIRHGRIVAIRTVKDGVAALQIIPKRGGKRTGAGHPPLPEGAGRTERVSVLLTPAQVRLLDELRGAESRSSYLARRGGLTLG